MRRDDNQEVWREVAGRLLAVLLAKGDVVDDPDRAEGGGEGGFAGVPVLALEVEFEVEVVSDGEVEAAAVAWDDGVIPCVKGVLREVDIAGADEEVDVGGDAAKGVCGAEADEVGVLGKEGVAIEVGAEFEGEIDGEALDVAGVIEAEGDAAGVLGAEGGVGELATGEDADVGGAAGSGAGLGADGEGEAEREQEKN